MSVETIQRKRQRKIKWRIRRTRNVFVLALVITCVIAAIVWLVRDKAPATDEVQMEISGLDWIMLDLLPINDYSRPGLELQEVNAIVIHYVGNPGTTAAQNRSYYERLAENGDTYASSNFIVGLDGEILECVPVSEVAYCSNWRNDDTISIECCHPDETGKFSEDTYASLVTLTAWLCSAFELDATELLRHYDITGKQCPKYYVEHPDEWETFKNDVQNRLDEQIAQAENG